MTRMNPQQKAIANVILDMVAAVDVSGETELPDGWTASFAVRLTELDAMPVVDDGETVRIDASPMAGSAALLVNVLISVIAEMRDADRLAVISTVREHIANEL